MKATQFADTQNGFKLAQMMKTPQSPSPRFARVRFRAVVVTLLAAGLPVRAALLVHLPYDNNSATNAGTLGSAHDGTLQGAAIFTTDAALGNGALACDAAAPSYVSHGLSPIGGATGRTVSVWTKNSIAPADGQRSLLGLGSTAGSPNGSKIDSDVDASAARAEQSARFHSVFIGRPARIFSQRNLTCHQS